MKGRFALKIQMVVLGIVLMFALAACSILPGTGSGNMKTEGDRKKSTVLLILDGFGLSDQSEH